MLVTFGEALFDLIPPDGESLATTSTLDLRPGGAPLNVAIGLRRLGRPSRYCGTLSSDPLGQRLADLIEREGAERYPDVLVGQPTRLALVDHGPEGSSFRFYGDDPADVQVTADEIDVAIDDTVDGLYVGSLMMAHPKGEQAQRHAVARARRLGVPVMVDPNPREPAWENLSHLRETCRWLLSKATLIKLSLHDAILLQLGESPEKVLHQHGWDADVVVTDGERGTWALIDGQLAHASGPAVEAIDPTGAGDAFFAGLIFRYLSDGGLTQDGLAFAAAAGALATTRSGAIAGLPRLEDVERLVM